MPLSGLVLTLENAAAARESLSDLLRAEPRVTIGELSGCWLAVATDTASDAESRELHDWLAALPGVVFVDVAAVSFPEEEAAALQPKLFINQT